MFEDMRHLLRRAATDESQPPDLALLWARGRKQRRLFRVGGTLLAASAVVIAAVAVPSFFVGEDARTLELVDRPEGLANSPMTSPQREGTGGAEIACSGMAGSFAADALEGQVLSKERLRQQPYGAALVEFFTEGEGAIEAHLFNTASEFRLLRESQEMVLVGGLREERVTSYFAVERGQNDAWQVRGWGDCEPRIVEDGLKTVRWSLLAVEGGTLRLMVHGGMCSGEEDTTTRIADIVTTETDERVVVTVWVSEGVSESESETCAGVGVDIPAAVELDAPLGDRQLLDGGMVPPGPPQRHDVLDAPR